MRSEIKIAVFLFASQISLQSCLAKPVQDHLAKIWQSVGGSSVHTKSYVYKGQRARHYTGGSSYFMREVRNRPLFSFQPPEFNMNPQSCFQNAVMNFGGFSHINSEEIKGKIKAITTNAGLTMAYLGISAISPVIGETVQEVFSRLQELGGFLAKDCETGLHIGAAAGDIAAVYSERMKNAVGKFKKEAGIKTDYAAFLRDYPTGRNEAAKKLAEQSETMQLEDINFAWKAINKLSIQDKEIKELMMTLSGTIIIKAPTTDNGSPSFRYISSAATDDEAIKALMEGNASMKILKCNEGDNKCLNPKMEEKKLVDQEDSFIAKVESYFEKFDKSIRDDEDPENDAQKFIHKCGFAALRINQVFFQNTSGNPKFERGALIKIAAWHILYNYLSDMLRDVSDATNILQIPTSQELNDFKRSLYEAKLALNAYDLKISKQNSLILQLVQRSEFLEQKMADETSKMLTLL
ncbi:MAG: conjugal transfer protein TraH [Rickettsiales bacterium]|nr:conjugal transfer protein TraH [Rickettsiales bacterium]